MYKEKSTWKIFKEMKEVLDICVKRGIIGKIPMTCRLGLETYIEEEEVYILLTFTVLMRSSLFLENYLQE